MTSLSRELGAEQDLDAFAATVRDRFGEVLRPRAERGRAAATVCAERAWQLGPIGLAPGGRRKYSASAFPSSVTGPSPYIHSRAMRCQLLSASSWPRTASVRSSSRRPKRCSGAMSWWRAVA